MPKKDSPARGRPKGSRPANALEEERPDVARELIFHLANPSETRTKRALAKLYNVPESQLYSFIGRNQKAIEAMKRKILVDNWDDMPNQFKALAALAVERSHEALPKASAKDAAIVAQIATDKVVFLENKGAHKVSIVQEHRHSFDELGAAIMTELQRRGLDMPTPRPLPPIPEEEI